MDDRGLCEWRSESDWQVLIRGAYVGYIDWDEFERNQVTLRQSANGFGSLARGTVPREGDGLLQGRVICGLCGNRMRVRYQKVSGRLEPYYVCHDVAAHYAGKPCQLVRGRAIDDAISALLLQTVGRQPSKWRSRSRTRSPDVLNRPTPCA